MTNSQKIYPFQGQTAIVTGASRGIGRAIALRLASGGANIIVNYSHDAHSAHQVVHTIKSGGGQAEAVQADVSVSDEVKELFAKVRSTFGEIQFVINSAGVVLSPPTPILDTSDEDYERVYNVNTRGTFHVLREAAKQISDGGRIVALSSSITSATIAGMGIYTGSKAAVEAMVRVLAAELGGRQITVNAIAPGMTETDMMHEVVPKDMIAHAGKMTSLGRLGQPDDIASVAAFLCSHEGGWMTGQTLLASGTAS
jgi:3-oxoacyl-[acyl-carrier protein] reductase